jgi:hypothetical protein
MANQNKLKAWVRYDGTGRVIAGGPILQRFKPKVGNWVEINANECCNDITTTTTTTSTSSTTTTSTTTVAPTTTTTTTTQAGIFAVLSNSSCGSGTAIQVQFTTGESLCDAPLAISGDFSSAPEEFYIVYNGISKLFVKTSPTTAQGAGGAPGECVVCG